MAIRKPARFRASCLQMNSGADWQSNLREAKRLSEKALGGKPDLIALPENFLWRGPSRDLGAVARQGTPEALEAFKSLARASRTSFLLGSLLEPAGRGKVYNASFLIGPEGKLRAVYRKIHLFDIGLHRKLLVRESRHVESGYLPVVAAVSGVKVGLSICYDVRFPELYRYLAGRGCRILLVPSNFTRETGKAHWRVLLRARAVENQAFVVAPAQYGLHPETGLPSFGHSLIVDPWGEILADAGEKGSGVIMADLNLRKQAVLRERFPVLRHRRLTISPPKG